MSSGKASKKLRREISRFLQTEPGIAFRKEMDSLKKQKENTKKFRLIYFPVTLVLLLASVAVNAYYYFI